MSCALDAACASAAGSNEDASQVDIADMICGLITAGRHCAMSALRHTSITTKRMNIISVVYVLWCEAV